MEAKILKFLSNSASILHLGKKYLSEWTIYDLQYMFLFVLGVFTFYIIERPGVVFKLFILGLFATGLHFPMSRKFFLPFLPIASWSILFYSCQFIPAERRPHIYVSVLPALENILYGDNLSAIIAKHTNAVKDVLAWLPYGVIHFTLPFITSAGLWWFGPPGLLPVFSRSFGYMNIAGVLTQLIFPCSPPWYEYTYGMNTPASYNMRGDPGGLARIDDLLGSKTYTETFGGSPLVFGAFPSLHSACAIIQTLFISYLMPKSRVICVIYVLWIWWACMYLTHHYMVDLVGGGVYAIVSFSCAWKWLPDVNYSYANRRVYLKNPLLPRNMGDISIDNFTSQTSHVGSLDIVGGSADTTMTTLLYETNDEFDLGDSNFHRNKESNNSSSPIHSEVFITDTS